MPCTSTGTSASACNIQDTPAQVQASNPASGHICHHMSNNDATLHQSDAIQLLSSQLNEQCKTPAYQIPAHAAALPAMHQCTATVHLTISTISMTVTANTTMRYVPYLCTETHPPHATTTQHHHHMMMTTCSLPTEPDQHHHHHIITTSSDHWLPALAAEPPAAGLPTESVASCSVQAHRALILGRSSS